MRPNVASVWNLPVIFIIENNGYGLSTPTNEQYNCKNIADKGVGYGIESMTLDGNNIIEVFSTIRDLRKKMSKKPKPYLIEFKTFRMRGHEEASGIKYVPKELIDEWNKKDPIYNYEKFLIDSKILNLKDIENIKQEISKEIESNLSISFNEEKINSSIENEISDVFRKFDFKKIKPTEKLVEKRFVDAISDGIKESMMKFDDLIIMGQDIAEYGGVFKITEGFVEKFGKDRVRNTPICESSIIEIAMGLSISKRKSIVELQFSDFITSGFNPVVNYLAKIHYRWGQNADVVLRMPCGAGVGPDHFIHKPTKHGSQKHQALLLCIRHSHMMLKDF